MRLKRSKGGAGDPMQVVSRFLDAANHHDVDALRACVHRDFESIQPIHPGRSFRGSGQLISNWKAIFEAEPGFRLTVLRSATVDDTVWVEVHGAGDSAEAAGIFIVGVENDRIRWIRVYSDLVEPAPEVAAEAEVAATGPSEPPAVTAEAPEGDGPAAEAEPPPVPEDEPAEGPEVGPAAAVDDPAAAAAATAVGDDAEAFESRPLRLVEPALGGFEADDAQERGAATGLRLVPHEEAAEADARDPSVEPDDLLAGGPDDAEEEDGVEPAAAEARGTTEPAPDADATAIWGPGDAPEPALGDEPAETAAAAAGAEPAETAAGAPGDDAAGVGTDGPTAEMVEAAPQAVDGEAARPDAEEDEARPEVVDVSADVTAAPADGGGGTSGPETTETGAAVAAPELVGDDGDPGRVRAATAADVAAPHEVVPPDSDGAEREPVETTDSGPDDEAAAPDPDVGEQKTAALMATGTELGPAAPDVAAADDVAPAARAAPDAGGDLGDTAVLAVPDETVGHEGDADLVEPADLAAPDAPPSPGADSDLVETADLAAPDGAAQAGGDDADAGGPKIVEPQSPPLPRATRSDRLADDDGSSRRWTWRRRRR